MERGKILLVTLSEKERERRLFLFARPDAEFIRKTEIHSESRRDEEAEVEEN